MALSGIQFEIRKNNIILTMIIQLYAMIFSRSYRKIGSMEVEDSAFAQSRTAMAIIVITLIVTILKSILINLSEHFTKSLYSVIQKVPMLGAILHKEYENYKVYGAISKTYASLVNKLSYFWSTEPKEEI